MNDLDHLRRPPQYERILARSRDVGFAMNSDLLTGSLLRTLAASKPSGAVLEIGTGCGLGTCWLLDGMDESATLTSVDIDGRIQAIAAQEMGADSRLTLVLKDGGEFLETTDRRFDLIYADAWPGKYTHLKDALALLKRGGIYLADDMLPQPSWPDGHDVKVAALIPTLQQLPGFQVTTLSWSTGLIVAVKR
jgi:predicted O-methyltransferase YrrM